MIAWSGVLPERLGGGLAEFVDVAAFDVERREQGECLTAHGLLEPVASA
jgi:hypothetical protein